MTQLLNDVNTAHPRKQSDPCECMLQPHMECAGLRQGKCGANAGWRAAAGMGVARDWRTRMKERQRFWSVSHGFKARH